MTNNASNNKTRNYSYFLKLSQLNIGLTQISSTTVILILNSGMQLITIIFQFKYKNVCHYFINIKFTLKSLVITVQI